jgi:hypothetical protein
MQFLFLSLAWQAARLSKNKSASAWSGSVFKNSSQFVPRGWSIDSVEGFGREDLMASRLLKRPQEVLMRKNPQSIFLKSRISPFPIIAGIMLTLASMYLFMSFAAAMGVWSYQFYEIPLLGPKFWTVASISWTTSVFIGALVSVLASGSRDMRNGILNALTTWSGGYLLFGGIALTMADTNLSDLLGLPVVGLFWHGFLGDAAALAAGVLGGVLGVLYERQSEKAKTSEKSFVEPAYRTHPV